MQVASSHLPYPADVQIDVGGLNEMARDRNRLCIEDPFEITYNVARTVTKDGLYTVNPYSSL